MTLVHEISAYSDPQGNEIIYSGAAINNRIIVRFTGKNNKLIVHENARIGSLNIRFDCDNGVFEIGSNKGVAPFKGIVRVGQDAKIKIGNNVSTTTPMQLSAVEGTTITIGDDVMVAGSVKLRGDDGHPIFDIETGKRINPAEDIVIGDHVWLGLESTILGGAVVAAGSVVATRAVVTKQFPNNCIIAGMPAKIIRENIAWERPHLSVTPPYYKPDSSVLQTTDWWKPTNYDAGPYAE